MGLYDTMTLVAAIRQRIAVQKWFTNRYFPTLPEDIFVQNKILIERSKGSRNMAPFVVPRSGGITMDREAMVGTSYKPPYIAPKRVLTIDDLTQLGFGEDPTGTMTPEEREQDLMAVDLEDLSDMIDRTVEWMCAQLLLNGEITMKHWADQYGSGKYTEEVLRFFDSTDGFLNKKTPTHLWSDSTHDIYGDLANMVEYITQNGGAATDLNMSSKVYQTMIKDDAIQKLLENRRMELGTIAPERLPVGVGHAGSINIEGFNLDMYVYNDTYIDEKKATSLYLPSDSIIIGAPNLGRTRYGAITQIEQTDNQRHTYRGDKIPQYISDPHSNVRTIKVSSAPVPAPDNYQSWSTAKVL